MVEVIIVTEGQSEETFVRSVLAPLLAGSNVFATARCVRTSDMQSGGSLSPERVRRFLRNTLRERDDTYVTTLFDLYALKPEMPGVAGSEDIVDPALKAAHIEQAMHRDIVGVAGCRPDRFFGHVQPHEFEALFFSDVTAFCELEPGWASSRKALQAVRDEYENPEWINNSPQTAPSRRLSILTPKYRKVRHGSLAANHIGLDRIRSECPHFAAWVERLLALSPL